MAKIWHIFHSFMCMLLLALHSLYFNISQHYLLNRRVSHCSAVFVCFGMFRCLYLLVAYFTTLFRINIMILFYLFTSSPIALGPRIDALKPLVKLIPDLPAASKAPATVKGYHSQFQKWKAWAASFMESRFFLLLLFIFHFILLFILFYYIIIIIIIIINI